MQLLYHLTGENIQCVFLVEILIWRGQDHMTRGRHVYMTRQSRILGDWEAFWSWPNSHTHTHTLLQHHIFGKHFGTHRRYIENSASTEFDLLVDYFPPSNTLIVHVYSFPRRTISLCSKTPPTHSLFKLDLIMARATTEVGTDPRELWSAFWASWRWNIFDSWFFFYELKMEWIMNFCQFCPCSLGGMYNCSTWITVVNFLIVPEFDRNHELWNYERIWKLPIALLPRELFSLGVGKWGGLGLFSLIHHLLVQVTRNHTENMMLNGIEVNVPGL